MSFWAIYGLFLLKAITIVAAIIIILIAIGLLKSKAKGSSAGRLEIKPLHREYHKKQRLIIAQLDKKRRKAMLKALKTTQKAQPTAKHILFVLQFKGDLHASQVAALREEVTAVIQIAQPGDRVVLKLESTGGAVNQYGFCASQLDRLKRANIPLTILIDKVAASGGYMMACVANQIIAAPFAYIGSIGVLLQLPNFNDWLKKHGVQFEQVSAGKYKRTLTMFGKNTSKDREKSQQELELIHQQFKGFVTEHRPEVAIDDVATGEYWLAQEAYKRGLVDQLMTSDDYLLAQYQTGEYLLLSVRLVTKKRNVLKKLLSVSEQFIQGKLLA